MKRISYLFFLIFLAALFASSCSNTKTYAQLLKDEQSLIDGFIKRNNITVQNVSTFPTNIPWVKDGKDVYALLPSGLYIHMINPGDTASKVVLELKNVVVTRYLQYSLGLPSDTVSNLSTIDFPYPPSFVYGDLTQSCKAFQEAASYMKTNDSEAKIIVPSRIGFQTEMMSVTPLGYDLKIKIIK